MATFISQISTSLLIFLFAATFGLSMSSDHKVVRCDETDRRTLLIFKQGIIDPLNQLSTWSNVTDCCAWNGVECHNTTGRVIKLDLFDLFLKGPIPCDWKNFKDLKLINLWNNQLSGEILMDLSNWTQLWFLNLGKNKFSGTIPIKMPQNLQVMILRSNQFEGNIPPQIFNLSFLGHLDLAHNKLSGSIPHSAYNITQMITDKIHGWLPSSIDLYTKGQYYEPYMDPERRTIDVSVNNFYYQLRLVKPIL
ncbi:hypothetical protein VNO77_42907 [Canavalia gladiata]|uniref:Leucine-rich repeat-containing N-terminal plant-type domain-containing protein n=1 Tax=Canavalia gladiata TaxID=3824 RepID=A0AAN9JVD9_CANGL